MLNTEIELLYEQMQPCAQEFLLGIARKYARRWPLPAPLPSPPLLPRVLDGRLDKVDNVINGAFPVRVREVVDGK